MNDELRVAGCELRGRAGGRQLAVAAALYAALVVPAMFSRDLWDPDEPRFAQIGREMLRSGDWVVPRMNGEPLALLPPLHDWVSAAVGLPFGDVTPAAARAGAALGGLLALAALWFLARRWWGDGAAFWSSVVLMTSVSFWRQASYAQVDMLLTGLVTAAFVAFRISWEEEDRGLRWFLAGCAFCALGTLTKGPLAVVAPGLVFLVLAVAERRRGFIRPAWLAAGLGLYLVLAAPWYVLACRRGGAAFTHELLVTHNFGMFFETWSHHQPPWYYLVNLPWMFAPWIAFLPGALLSSRDALRPAAATLSRAVFRPETRDPEAGRHRFLWIWFVSLFLFFSISQAKQTKYLLPALPAAALLVGLYADRLARGETRVSTRAFFVLAAVGMLAAGAALAAFKLPTGRWPVSAKIRTEAHSFLNPALLASVFRMAFVLGVAWVAAAWAAARRPRAALSLVAAGMTVACLVASLDVFRDVDRMKSARWFCETVRVRLDRSPGVDVGIYGIQERKMGAFRYYLDRPVATFEDAEEHSDPAALVAWWSAEGSKCLIRDAADPLPAAVGETSEVVDRASIGHRTMEALRKK